jgi:DNA-binding IclR family transcriptional regulator
MSSSSVKDGTQSIGRSLAVLRLVMDYGHEGLGLRELARTLGLTVATAHRILKYLADEGILAKDPDSRRYRIGPNTMELGLATGAVAGFVETCRPLLQRLSEATQDTIYLSVRTGLVSLCVDQIEASYPIRASTMKVGSKVPFGIGAGSFAILARLPIDEFNRLIPRLAPALRNYPGFTVQNMLDHVAEARRTGIGVSREIINPGISGIGTAILNTRGHPFASVAIGSITPRIYGERFELLRDILRTEVRQFHIEQNARGI